jgi:O-antigen biosynthesis protein
MTDTTLDSLRAPARAQTAPDPPAPRVEVRGKFLFAGEHKLYLRGVTYGTFAPDPEWGDYPGPHRVEQDFAAMAAAGINSVRVYTVPPRWLLDLASLYGLRVMVGLPWEQHVAFLDDRARQASIEQRVREGVRACAGHPAVLAYVVGNEIPASIVRWHGARRVERFLERLYDACKQEDPDALVTYVNFPSTEYLDVAFADFFCFNVYLEARDRLESYIARLQNLAGEKPLVMAEIGLDSRRNGIDVQAGTLEWQVDTVFAGGCSGAFLFAWTDEWHRGGFEVEDWDFGLVDRRRRPKPALDAVRRAYSRVPLPLGGRWPRVSVVVCTFNGERTIEETLTGIERLHYPDYEVIVVDDGSTDRTAEIAARHDVQLISTHNRGLSAARNTGAEAAGGEIVAFCDDDAWPDRDWLLYAVHELRSGDHAGVGGPNLPPPDDGPIAQCIANAPGGPLHVLVSDRVAEHVPGCNSLYLCSAFFEVGGFDPSYRTAGDDVDFCWRLQEHGYTIGFSPAATVWHHRRNSVRTYWRQQRGYGRAEALLERKWPQRYNCLGHLTWGGRLYGRGLTHPLNTRRRIRHGTWGAALFQSVYEPAAGNLTGLLLMPEWYLLMLVVAAASLGALAWSPLVFAVPLVAVALGASVATAVVSAARASFEGVPVSLSRRCARFALTAALYLMQPAARLAGRLGYGLTPWRRRSAAGMNLPSPRTHELWSETWQSAHERLEALESRIRAAGATARRGGDFDRWDLEIRAGLLGGGRLRMAIEEHGAGTQLIRVRAWPRWYAVGRVLTLCLILGAIAAFTLGAVTPGAALTVLALIVLVLAAQECAAAAATVRTAVQPRGEPQSLGVLIQGEERA